MLARRSLTLESFLSWLGLPQRCPLVCRFPSQCRCVLLLPRSSSCSSLSFLSLLSGLPVQMRSSDHPLPSVFFTPPLSIFIHVHYASSTFNQTLCDMQSSHVVHYIQCICSLVACTDHELRTVFKGFRAYV